MKICSECKKEKADTEFWPRRRRGHTTLNSQCKPCNLSTRRIIRRANKMRIISLLGGKCQRCGHKSATGVSLSIDHRKPSSISYEARRDFLTWTWDKIVEEIKAGDCWLLCLNCHAEVEEERGYLGRNVWKLPGNGLQSVLNTEASTDGRSIRLASATPCNCPSCSKGCSGHDEDDEDLEGCPI